MTTLDFKTMAPGTKVRLRDGDTAEFVAYRERANLPIIAISNSNMWILLRENGVMHKDRAARQDIIGVVKTVRYPELWLVRWTSGGADVYTCDPVVGLDSRATRAICTITHIPAVEVEE